MAPQGMNRLEIEDLKDRLAASEKALDEGRADMANLLSHQLCIYQGRRQSTLNEECSYTVLLEVRVVS